MKMNTLYRKNKDGEVKECRAQEEQVSRMEKSGWSKKNPSVEAETEDKTETKVEDKNVKTDKTDAKDAKNKSMK